MNKEDKCPNCGCTETITYTFTHDQGFLEETWCECNQCKILKYHWSYGCIYVENWKDKTFPPNGEIIRKVKVEGDEKEDDLPF